MSSQKRGGRKVYSIRKRAMREFLSQCVSTGMVRFLSDRTRMAVQCDPSPTRSRDYQSDSRSFPQNITHPRQEVTPSEAEPGNKVVVVAKRKNMNPPLLEDFITHLVRRSNVQVPTLMATLVYLERIRFRIAPISKDDACTLHRVFLATLILSSKYHNDSSPRNRNWANFSNIYPDCGFNLREVNFMEIQILGLLNWNLRVSNKDLYRNFEPFLTPICDAIFERDMAASIEYIPDAYPVRDFFSFPPPIHPSLLRQRRGSRCAGAPNRG
ncbi:hypothetical protein EPUL_006687, partial [Erysiphe pulchra]